LINAGIQEISISFSNLPPWEDHALGLLRVELAKLEPILVDAHKKTGHIPVAGFRIGPGQGIMTCSAGADRMTLAADGTLWGCYMFPSICIDEKSSGESSRFCFGHLNSFKKDYLFMYPEIVSRYRNLSMSIAATSQIKCLECKELETCRICLVSAALSSGEIGTISDWTCEIQKIMYRSKKAFWLKLI
jgi:hypothetical protein